MGWPKSIRLRYSLRALFVLVTMFMIWGGYHANRGWKQRQAEAVLRQHGGSVGVGKGPYEKSVAGRVALVYDSLVYALWGDAPVNVVDVPSPLTPEVVDAIVALPQVPALYLAPRRTTSEETHRMLTTGKFGPHEELPSGALERILKRHEINTLWLCNWKLGEADCRAIAGEETLVSLELLGVTLSEEACAHLLTRPHFSSLNLSFCSSKGEKLSGVPGSTSLERIECDRTPLGNEFAAFVGRCPNVSYFSIAHSGITDAFVAEVGPHPALTHVGFHGGVITDEAALTLEKMPSLKVIGLPPNSLSDKAIARLRADKSDLLIQQQ